MGFVFKNTFKHFYLPIILLKTASLKQTDASMQDHQPKTYIAEQKASQLRKHSRYFNFIIINNLQKYEFYKV